MRNRVRPSARVYRKTPTNCLPGLVQHKLYRYGHWLQNAGGGTRQTPPDSRNAEWERVNTYDEIKYRFKLLKNITIKRNMPSKKKKYNSRFPPARIKKIMQTDEEIGKVAAAVPVIISRALELFLESLLTKACQVTQSRNAKTMTMSHLKQCIELEQQFDFLKDLVAAMPDVQGDMEDSHTEGGDRVSRRGGKPVSGRKNGGVSTKGKEKKQSGTESEQEDDSEESETEEDEEEEGSQSSTNLQTASHFNSSSVGPNAVTQYDHMRAAQGLALPLGNFTPMNSSLLHAVPVLPACHGNGDDDDDDEDYDC
uniref:Dr1-associated corepressor n=1 Tax=Paramormyrops kingsleyae TaxID=1676925 RepID=A0A3B3S061_9TELE|nr:dr1-associated corepressor-like isoform X1 [Paramormyrops kingsleyae]